MAAKRIDPGEIAVSHGVGELGSQDKPKTTIPRHRRQGGIMVRLKDVPDDKPRRFYGRDAKVLERLVLDQGEGCQASRKAAQGWANSVFNLRDAGLEVETVRNPRGDRKLRCRARYILRTPLAIISDDDKAAT